MELEDLEMPLFDRTCLGLTGVPAPESWNDFFCCCLLIDVVDLDALRVAVLDRDVFSSSSSKGSGSSESSSIVE